MEKLNGKTAFITGGASGIGLAIAKACAGEGMNIVIADMRQNAIDEALPLFREKNQPVLGVRLNVTDREAFARAADEAEAAFGNIHLLVNNAGIGGAHVPLWEASFRETDLALGINITGVLNGIQTIVPRMIKHGEEGHIVSTSSKAALIAVSRNGLYNLAKQAVIGITESLATDLQGTSIGCSVFCPGPFKTNLGATSGEVTRELIGEVPAEVPRFAREGEEPPPFVRRMAELERAADEAGRRVVRGVKRGDLYIFTHTEFMKGFKSRVDAMLRAFPDEKPDEEFYQVYSFLTQNPIFDKQTDVPALTD